MYSCVHVRVFMYNMGLYACMRACMHRCTFVCMYVNPTCLSEAHCVILGLHAGRSSRPDSSRPGAPRTVDN